MNDEEALRHHEAEQARTARELEREQLRRGEPVRQGGIGPDGGAIAYDSLDELPPLEGEPCETCGQVNGRHTITCPHLDPLAAPYRGMLDLFELNGTRFVPLEQLILALADALERPGLSGDAAKVAAADRAAQLLTAMRAAMTADLPRVDSRDAVERLIDTVSQRRDG